MPVATKAPINVIIRVVAASTIKLKAAPPSVRLHPPPSAGAGKAGASARYTTTSDIRKLLEAHNIRLSDMSPGDHYATCPECSAGRQKAHQTLKCLSVKIDDKGACWRCHHCGWTRTVNRGATNTRSPIWSPSTIIMMKAASCFFQVCRKRDKSFPQRRPDGNGGWSWKLGDAPCAVPSAGSSRGDRRAGARCTWFEGEKDADNARALGLTATCSPGGAAKPGQTPKWRKAYSEMLRGADVVIYPDHDGRPDMRTPKQPRAYRLGVAKRVRVLRAGRSLAGDPEKKRRFFSDWSNVGHTRADLDALVDATPDFAATVEAVQQPEPAKLNQTPV